MKSMKYAVMMRPMGSWVAAGDEREAVRRTDRHGDKCTVKTRVLFGEPIPMQRLDEFLPVAAKIGGHIIDE
jgi:hypothetical protein